MGPTRWARPLLGVYLLALAVVVLSPTNGAQSAVVDLAVRVMQGVGLPADLVTFTRTEVLANVVMVVPAGALAALCFPHLRWQDWAAYGFLVALTVELVQGLLLPGREASATDVVANTLGALVGALAVSLVVRRLASRPSR